MIYLWFIFLWSLLTYSNIIHWTTALSTRGPYIFIRSRMLRPVFWTNQLILSNNILNHLSANPTKWSNTLRQFVKGKGLMKLEWSTRFFTIISVQGSLKMSNCQKGNIFYVWYLLLWDASREKTYWKRAKVS